VEHFPYDFESEQVVASRKVTVQGKFGKMFILITFYWDSVVAMAGFKKHEKD
jgi:hypothetical protein